MQAALAQHQADADVQFEHWIQRELRKLTRIPVRIHVRADGWRDITAPSPVDPLPLRTFP